MAVETAQMPFHIRIRRWRVSQQFLLSQVCTGRRGWPWRRWRTTRTGGSPPRSAAASARPPAAEAAPRWWVPLTCLDYKRHSAITAYHRQAGGAASSAAAADLQQCRSVQCIGS